MGLDLIRDQQSWLDAITSECPQEREQVRLLLFREPRLEARVVEPDHIRQRCRGSVMEIRRPRGQRAKHGPLELADVTPFAGYHRPSGIGGLNGLTRRP